MPPLPIPMPTDLSDLLTVMDFIGAFVFGLSGGTLAVRKRLDLFGVMVLSLAAALAAETEMPSTCLATRSSTIWSCSSPPPCSGGPI